jgi:hypothetical protein
LTTEISLYDNTLSNNRTVNVSELKENSQLPNDFDIKSFCNEINKVWNSFSDLSFVDIENPLATTFSLPKLILLYWSVRFYERIKIKRRSKMTSRSFQDITKFLQKGMDYFF